MTIEEKLALLVELQKIDDKIQKLKEEEGTLPKEIRDLEVQNVSLLLERKKLEEAISNYKATITKNKSIITVQTRIKESREELLENEVFRSEREYKEVDSEIELATLEIEAAERRIKKAEAEIERLEKKVAEIAQKQEEYTNKIEAKRELLNNIKQKIQENIQNLLPEREKIVQQLDENLYKQYEIIRRKAGRGLAVVTVDRDACGGCFILMTPQTLYEIRLKDKIITCESCGRIVVDPSFFGNEKYWEEQEVAKKSKRRTRRTLKKAK